MYSTNYTVPDKMYSTNYTVPDKMYSTNYTVPDKMYSTNYTVPDKMYSTVYKLNAYSSRFYSIFSRDNLEYNSNIEYPSFKQSSENPNIYNHHRLN